MCSDRFVIDLRAVPKPMLVVCNSTKLDDLLSKSLQKFLNLRGAVM